MQGGERYATRVAREGTRLSSTCSCPVGYACKHAIAVVLEHQARASTGQAVPVADEADPRLTQLDGEAEAEAWDEWEDDLDADEDEFEDEVADALPARPAPPTATRGAAGPTGDVVRQFLDGQTKEQLVALIEQLAAAHPAVRTALTDRAELASGSLANLVRGARRDIDGLDAELSWSNRRSMDPRIRLRRVRERLETLLAGGHVDEVMQLGNALVKRGRDVVQTIDDEGETGVALQECLSVVVEALPRSSLAPVEQMLWVADAERHDPYDALDTAAFWEIERPVETWSAFADALNRRLRADDAAPPAQDSYSRDYARDQLTDELVAALHAAERDDEVIPLLEREAVRTNSYARLVRALREAGRVDEADAWARKGMAATAQRWPGIAGELARALSELRAEAGDWAAVAAIRADEFFRYPSVRGLQALEEAAERAGVRDQVRTAALRFLETGQLPFAVPPKESAQSPRGAPKPRRGKSGSSPGGAQAGGARSAPSDRAGDRSAVGAGEPAASSAWPLPDLGLAATDRERLPAQPRFDVLVELAIEEGRPADALRWRAELQRRSAAWSWGIGQSSLDDRVADAVAASHPDEAIAIWKQRAEKQVDMTDVRAYEVAADYLKKLRPVLGEDAWRTYVAGLREANRRKRRLVEILDQLVAKPTGR